MMITSAQNPKVKLVRALLASKKERDENCLFVVEGVRLAEESNSAGFKPVLAFYSSQLSGRGNAIITALQSQGIEPEEISPDLLDRISDTQTSQGILLALPLPEEIPESSNLALAMDQVRDPGNMGTLMRSAAALGFRNVILTPGSADPYSPKVLRSAMGAHFKISVLFKEEGGIDEFCRSQNQPPLRICMADAHNGKRCWEVDLSTPLCLVIGGEAEGASTGLRNLADETIAIPMESGTESFNAAVSGSILMYEIFRQRNLK